MGEQIGQARRNYVVYSIDFGVRLAVAAVPALANDSTFVYHHAAHQRVGAYAPAPQRGQFERAPHIKLVGGHGGSNQF